MIIFLISNTLYVTVSPAKHQTIADEPVCLQRFHSLTGDGRMRLLVLSSSSATALTLEASRAAAKTRNCRRAYRTLAEAVQGSRRVAWHGTHL